MVDEEQLENVELQDHFYRDSIGSVVLILLGICLGIGLLVVLSLYLHFTKPSPTTFFVYKEWRVQDAVPVDQPYLSTPDLLQWVGEFLPKAFVFDFIRYNDQLKAAEQYFTPNGWTVFVSQLNNYVSYNDVTTKKQFVTANPAGAPIIINQGKINDGTLAGRYGWWVQFPVTINFASAGGSMSRTLNLQVLVIRISTLNNLNGVGIENVLVTNASTPTSTPIFEGLT